MCYKVEGCLNFSLHIGRGSSLPTFLIIVWVTLHVKFYKLLKLFDLCSEASNGSNLLFLLCIWNFITLLDHYLKFEVLVELLFKVPELLALIIEE